MDKKFRTGDDWWYSAKDAATYTGLPKSFLFQLAKHGLLRRSWPGFGPVLFRRCHLDALIAMKAEAKV